MDFRRAPQSKNFIDNTGAWKVLVDRMRAQPDLRMNVSPAFRAREEIGRLSDELMQFNELLRYQQNGGGRVTRPFIFDPGILRR